MDGSNLWLTGNIGRDSKQGSRGRAYCPRYCAPGASRRLLSIYITVYKLQEHFAAISLAKQGKNGLGRSSQLDRNQPPIGQNKARS